MPMSAIKHPPHPEEDYNTPQKHALTTNASLLFSQTLHSLDNRSFGRGRTTGRSHQLFLETHPEDVSLHEEQNEQNNSSITLQPTYTREDVLDMLELAKLVHFLAKQHEEGKEVVRKRERVVRGLLLERGVMEERIERGRKEYERRREVVVGKVRRERRERGRRASVVESEISEMRDEIEKMRRTLSGRKQKGSLGKQDKERDRQKQTQRESRDIQLPKLRQKRIIYVPMPIAQQYSRPDFPTQPPVPQPHPLYTQQHSQSEPISLRQSHLSHREQYQSEKKTSLFDILSENLQKGTVGDTVGSSRGLPFDMGVNSPQPRMVHSLNPHIPTHPYMQPLPIPPPIPPAPVPPSQQMPTIMQQLSYAINLQMNGAAPQPQPQPTKQQSPDLAYLNCLQKSVANSSIDLDQPSKKSHKSHKSLRNSQRSLHKSTNKWKNNDQQDLQMLDLLQNSQKPAPTPLPLLPNKPKYSEMGAKITETNLMESDFVLSLPEASRQHSFSSSKIHISIHSDEKPNQSLSHDHPSLEKREETLPMGSTKREHAVITQSNINIEVNDNNSSRSSDHSTHSVHSPNRQSKTNLSLMKAIPKIDQVSEDGKSQKNVPMQVHPIEPPLSTSQELPASPPLSKPPSLSEHSESQDDMIDSIKLSAQSKLSRPQPPSKTLPTLLLPLQSNIEQQLEQQHEEQNDDFLGSIKLATESRISRQKSDRAVEQKEEDLEVEVGAVEVKMSRSDLVEERGIGMENMEAEDSELRRSTTSSVIRKGSAIQKSKRPTTLSVPTKTNLAQSSLMAMSAQMTSMAIQEADESEQQLSSIQRKRPRNPTPSH